jgi:hypothetical protein
MRFTQLKKISLFAVLVFACGSAFGSDCNTAGYPCMNLDSQIKGSRWPAWGVDSGTANAYAITTVAPLGPALKTGSKIQFIAVHSNTAASTLAVNGGTAINLVNPPSTALTSGSIIAGDVIEAVYDGTNFQCITCATSSGGGGGGSGTFNPNSVTLFDDFLGGSTTQALGWTASGNFGAFNNQPLPSGPATPGLVELSTGSSSGDYEYFILGLNNTGGNHFNPQAQTFKVYFRANNQGGGVGTVRVGAFDNRGVQNPNGVYFESGSAQSNGDWWCIQENSATITKADSGITAPTATYHTLEFDAASTTSIVWKIDGTAVCGGIAATNIPNTELTIASEASASAAGAAPRLWLDYFRLDLTTTGR